MDRWNPDRGRDYPRGRPFRSRNTGFRGRRGGMGRGRGRGRGGYSNGRDRSKRAPLTDANRHLMDAIEQSENACTDSNKNTNTNTNGNAWKDRIITRSKVPQEINSKHTQKPLRVTTNTYPITFNSELFIAEWELRDKDSNKLTDLNRWRKIYKNKANRQTLNTQFKINYGDDNSMSIFTVQSADDHNSNSDNQTQDISINIDDSQYRLALKHGCKIGDFIGSDNITITHTRILERIIHHFFSKQQYRKREGAYFKSDAGMKDIEHCNKTRCSYIEGFNARIQFIKKKPHFGVKLWSRFICLDSDTVRQYLKDRKSESLFVGKRCMVTYSMNTIEIDGVDTTQTDKDGFLSALTKKQTSYREHVSEQYNIDLRDIREEKYGLIIDKKGNRYLPQFLRVIIDNKTEKAKQTSKILNANENDRIDTRAKLVDILSQKNEIFSIDRHPIRTDGFILSDPQIEMNINGETKRMDMSEGMRSWRFLKGTIDSKVHKKGYEKWKIYIYDTGGNDRRTVDQLRNHIHSYINKRNFRDFWRSEIKEVSQRELNDIFEGKSKRCIVMCLIEGDVRGSENKRTLHAQFLQYGIKSQFIEKRNATHNIKVYGAMDDCMFKIGESLYAIRSSQTYHNSLLLGFDVNHCTNRQTNRPSIGVMTGIRKYYIPKQNRIDGCVVMMNKGQEQPSKELAKEMCKNVFLSQLSQYTELPTVIWYFRDGISESQFKKLTFAEIEGIKEAIKEIKNCEKLRKYFNEKLEEWQPKLEIVVIQKRISDKFYTKDAQRMMTKSSNTYIVPYDIVDKSYLDLYIKKGAHHPLRIVFVIDELEFAKNGKIMDLCQFLLDLLYCFPYGMPLGACSIPAPIKWSDKLAQTYQELIDSDKHRSYDDVSKFLNLAYIEPKEPKESERKMDTETTTDNRQRKSVSSENSKRRQRRESRDSRNRSSKSKDRDRTSVSSENESSEQKQRRESRNRSSKSKDRDRRHHRRDSKHRKRSRSRSRSRSRKRRKYDS